MPEDMLSKAITYFKEGAVEKSLMVLMRYLSQNPNDPRALELRGDIAVKEEYRDEAVMRYERAGELFATEGNYERAIICLEKANSLMPNQLERLGRLASFYESYGLGNEMVKRIISYCEKALKNGRDELIIDALKKICDFDPGNLELRFIHCKLLTILNRKEEARSELTRIKALAEEQKNQPLIDEIIKFTNQFDGGEELDPKSRIELGNLLLEIGSKEEAVVEFLRAANDLLKMGQLEEARKILNRVLEVDPNNPQAISEIEHLSSKSAPKPEVEEVKKEKEIETESKEYVGSDFLKDLIAEVDTFPKQEEVKEEEHEELSKILEMGKMPEKPSIEGQIADIEFLLKETAPAERTEIKEGLNQLFEDFKSKIRWVDEDVDKRLDLAKAFFNSHMYDRALANLDVIKTEDSRKRALITEMKGACLVKMGRFTEALKILPEGLVAPIGEREKLGIRYNLALAYQGQGDYQNALIQLERILRTEENYRDAKELYELLGGTLVKPEGRADLVEATPEIVEEERPTEKVTIIEEEPVVPEIQEEKLPVIEEEPVVFVEEKEEPPVDYSIIEETPEKMPEFGFEKPETKFVEPKRSEENIVFL